MDNELLFPGTSFKEIGLIGWTLHTYTTPCFDRVVCDFVLFQKRNNNLSKISTMVILIRIFISRRVKHVRYFVQSLILKRGFFWLPDHDRCLFTSHYPYKVLHMFSTFSYTLEWVQINLSIPCTMYSRQKKYSSTWDSTCDISLFWVPIFIILCLL